MGLEEVTYGMNVAREVWGLSSGSAFHLEGGYKNLGFKVWEDESLLGDNGFWKPSEQMSSRR